MSKKIASVWMLILPVCLFCQNNFTVTGTVYDGHTHTVLPGTLVKLAETTAVADAEGRFIFPNIPQGNYTLVAEHHACDSFREALLVDKNLKLEIHMEHAARELAEVIITRKPHEKTSLTVSELSLAELKRLGTENLGNVLSRISGVQTLKTGNSIVKPVIRGQYGSRIAVFTDGTRLQEQEWGVEHAPSIAPSQFDKVRVIKGAGTLAYAGDISGGVVLMESQDLPKKDTLMGDVALFGISNGKGGGMNANIALVTNKNWEVRYRGGYKKLGDLFIPNTTLQNTGSEEYHSALELKKILKNATWSAKVSYVDQKLGIFKGAHIGSPVDFYSVVSSQEPIFTGDFSYQINAPRQEVSHLTGQLYFEQRTHHLGSFNFAYGFQKNHRKEYDIRIGELADVPGLDLDLKTHTLRAEHRIKNHSFGLHSGLTATYQDNFADPVTKRRRLIPDYQRYLGGAFAVGQYQINPHITVEAGLRYDFSRIMVQKYYDAKDWQRYLPNFQNFYVRSIDSRVYTEPEFTYHNFSANLGGIWNVSPSQNLKLNLSRSSRAPNPAELFSDGLHHSAAIIERGSLHMKPEDTYQANLSWEGSWATERPLHWKLEPFYMQSQNYIIQVPAGTETGSRGTFPVWAYEQVAAKMYGADAELTWDFAPGFHWSSNASWLRGEDETNHEPLIMIPPFRWKNTLSWTLSEHGWTASVGHLYVARQNRFPKRNISVDLIENNQAVTRVIDYSTPPPAYQLWELMVEKKFQKHWTIGLSVENMLNATYRDYLNRLRFFSPDMGRNITLQARWSF